MSSANNACAYLDILGFKYYTQKDLQGAAALINNYKMLLNLKFFTAVLDEQKPEVSKLSQRRKADSFDYFLPFSDCVFIQASNPDLFVHQISSFLLRCFLLTSREYESPVSKEDPAKILKGYGENPMILLTNLDISKRSLDWILEIYLTRWKCEESYRFIKQGYNLEDVRVLTYTSLRNLLVMVRAVFYFVSVELGRKLKLNILLKKVYEKAKRFFEIPDFRQYAIADGIYRILFGQKSGLQEKPQKPTNQLLFPFILME